MLRDDLEAPLERFEADLPAPLGLRAADERLAPDADDFERDAAEDFLAALDRFAVDERDELPLDRFAFEDDRDGLRAPLDLRADDADDPGLDAPLELSLGAHLPDITRCAASATASAMIEPSFVALDITLLAARSAVSAASRPASRIFLRADGLALIAAAAAARPAASISLLIAALASLSTVLLLELERDDDEREPDEDLPREELLRADFAIFYLPPLREKTL
ncbi:MAG TPA: hypothetical protein VN713_05250 [Sphingomicrobium sp.]|nr:hypothetical protein [Sphingomicrobium sp.]